MNIDLSLFKNIDFTSRDNLLFSGIIFIAVIILLIVVIIILKNIYNLLAKFLKRLFRIRDKKLKHGQVEEGGSPARLQSPQNTQEYASSPTTKTIAMNQSGSAPDSKENNDENIKNSLGNLGGLVNDKDFKGDSVAPMQKVAGTSNFRLGDKKIEGKNEAQQSYKEKETKSISESLGKLKADQDRGKDTVESKMPSRGPKVEDLSHQPIKINKPKDFSKDEDVREGFVGGAGRKDIFGKEIKNKDEVNAKTEIKKVGPKKTLDKNSSKIDDGTIFEGEPEVSRRHIEHEVRVSPKVWQASKAVGLTLSPIERTKLIKEVFSPEYGVNISKKDLQTSLRKLNRKMLNTTKDPKAHEKLRKEIKFFKKIGGIK